MTSIKFGDVLFLKGFRHFTRLPKDEAGYSQLDFAAPARGKCWAALLLSVVPDDASKDADEFSPDKLLNSYGWHFLGDEAPPLLACGHPITVMVGREAGDRCPSCEQAKAEGVVAAAKEKKRRRSAPAPRSR